MWKGREVVQAIPETVGTDHTKSGESCSKKNRDSEQVGETTIAEEVQ